MEFKILAHTHWDREWYFTHYKSRVYSYLIFDEILDYLSQSEVFTCFILDGQTSIIEEYLRYRPQKEALLRKLVKDRRLMTGPWYSQTDTLVISGESIVRNLLYGTAYANNLGHSMAIGYLPDSFGMSEQMPQIYNGFNLNYTMFRRGIADSIAKDREFYWLSPDGSKVFCHNIYHYGSMAYPPESEKEIERYILDMVKLLGPSSKTGKIVLFNGEDQKPIRKNLPEIINTINKIGAKYDIKASLINPEDLMEELEDSPYHFGEYQGEMTFGQHSRTHKSIFSTRYDLKQRNNYLENYIVNVLEPLMVMAHIHDLNYEALSIKDIWKRMLQNAAHDSIGMCNSDLTNNFINNRFDDVSEFSKNLVALKLRQIAMNIEEKDPFQFQVFNLLPYKRNRVETIEIYVPAPCFEIVKSDNTKLTHEILAIEDVTEKIFKLSVREAGVAGDINAKWIKECKQIYKAKLKLALKDMSPFGYETLYVKALEDCTPKLQTQALAFHHIENPFFKIGVLEDKIFLFDKRSNHYYDEFITIEDDGDEGDSYDYSEPSDNYIISHFRNIHTKATTDKFHSCLIITGEILVPENLNKRASRELDRTINLQLKIVLEHTSALIKVKVKLLNTALEHRMRLVISTDIPSTYSIADEQFGTIKRPVVLDFPNWREEGFNEKPRTIEPMMNFCALQNDQRTVQVLTDDVREYQIIGKHYDKIAMTIFRSTSYLGKEALNDRPGRASGNTSETFDTRFLNQEVSAEYAILIDNSALKFSSMAKLAKDIYTPCLYYQAAAFKNNTEHLILSQNPSRTLPLTNSFLEYEGEAVLSAVKKEEAGDNIILRFYNADCEKTITDSGLTLKSILDPCKITQVKLDEQTLVVEENLAYHYRPCQQKTFKIHL